VVGHDEQKGKKGEERGQLSVILTRGGGAKSTQGERGPRGKSNSSGTVLRPSSEQAKKKNNRKGEGRSVAKEQAEEKNRAVPGLKKERG